MIWFVIPFFVYIFAAAFIAVINARKINIGGSWMSAMIASVLVLGWTLFMLLRGVRVAPLLEVEGGDYPIQLLLDEISLPYLVALSVLLTLLMLTAPSAMEPQSGPRLWIYYLLIQATAFSAVYSYGLWWIIICWTVFDIIDVVSQYFQNQPHHLPKSTLIAAASRLFGTLLTSVCLAMGAARNILPIESYSAEGGLTGNIPPVVSGQGAIILLGGCLTRLGIMPLNHPFADRDKDRIGLGMLLQIASILTVLPLLSRIDTSAIPPQAAVLMSYAIGIAAFVGALGWLLSHDPGEGYSYAVMAVSCMTFACVLRGRGDVAVTWGLSLVMSCAPLALYQTRSPLLSLLPISALICFSGLPYTPNARGWEGLISLPFSAMDVLFSVVPLLILAGGFRLALSYDGKKFADLEPWMRTVYPLGLVIAPATQILMAYGGGIGGGRMGIPAASFPVFLGAIGLSVLTKSVPENSNAKNTIEWIRAGAGVFWRFNKRLLDMNWLWEIGRQISVVADKVIYTLSNLLENPGGLVWEILILAMMMAAVFSGGGY